MKIIVLLIVVFLYLRQGRKILRICDDWHKSGSFMMSPWCAVLFPRHRRSCDEDDVITWIFRRTSDWFYSFLIIFFWLPLVILTWLAFIL